MSLVHESNKRRGSAMTPSSPSRTRRFSEPSFHAPVTKAVARPTQPLSTSYHTSSFPPISPHAKRAGSPTPPRRSASKPTPTSSQPLSPARQIRQSERKSSRPGTAERRSSLEQKQDTSRSDAPLVRTASRTEFKSTRFADSTDTIVYRNSDVVGDLLVNHSYPQHGWQSKTHQLNEISPSVSIPRSLSTSPASPVHSHTNSLSSVPLLPSKPQAPLARHASSDLGGLAKRLEAAGIKDGSPGSCLKDGSRYSPLVQRRSFGASTSALSTSSMAISSEGDAGRYSTICCRNGLVGLRNLGNTCFMNSMLQCLSNTHKLTRLLLSGEATRSKQPPKHGLVEAYIDLLKEMWEGIEDGSALSPITLKQRITKFAPRFQGYDQQDSQEFLRFMLAGLHEELNTAMPTSIREKEIRSPSPTNTRELADRAWKRYLSIERSRISDLFMGQLKSTLRCLHCGHTSFTFDPFWDLSLTIPRTSSSHQYTTSYGSSYGSGGYVDLLQCFQLFTTEEKLDGNDKPFCSKCQKSRKSTKQFSIQRFPEILVIHLKRFSGCRFRTKLNTMVSYTNSLDLSRFATEHGAGKDCQYQLYAVSNHSGSTYGGHYTAYCKHPTLNKWHTFNDSRYYNMTSNLVATPEAYVLFYQRV